MTITAADYAKHGIRKSGRQYLKDGQVLSSAEVSEIVGKVTKKPVSNQQMASGCNDFDKLNAATQAFFFSLCEQIIEATRDASAELGVTLGKDIPSIGLENAPRLTNLKKAGVFERGGNGWVRLTEFGRAIFLATV